MRLYGAIEKVEPQDDGTVRVHGIATSETVDDQDEIVRADAMRAALPDYMRFPALREMHQLLAAGTTLEAEVGDETGCFLIAEVFGARKMIYVKDEDGLYTADPKKDPAARHIPRISLQELLEHDQDDLVVERAVLDLMLTARHIREIQFVNGLKPGQLSAALDGEPVGTIIYNAAGSHA